MSQRIQDRAPWRSERPIQTWFPIQWQPVLPGGHRGLRNGAVFSEIALRNWRHRRRAIAWCVAETEVLTARRSMRFLLSSREPFPIIWFTGQSAAALTICDTSAPATPYRRSIDPDGNAHVLGEFIALEKINAIRIEIIRCFFRIFFYWKRLRK